MPPSARPEARESTEAAPVALVTGGAKRLGAAFNRRLAARGYRIALHYRESDAEAEALSRELAGLGHDVHSFPCDLTAPNAPSDLVERVVRHFGRLDLLVNSAAGMERTPVGTVTAEELDRIFALNVRAPFLAAQAAAAHIGEGGSIVNMADLAAFETWGGYIPHSMSKAAVVQMTRALAKKLAPRIRVNAIAPGVVLLPEGFDERSAAHLESTTPLRRIGDPSDVVRALDYLLDATFVTGEILLVDGGRHVRR